MHVEFYRHNVDETDIERVSQVLRSVFLTSGPVTAEFEQKFADYTGVPHVVGLSSCSGALHLALLTLGIGPGDEVITTPMTFIATTTVILHVGATPVYVDVEPDTGLIDPEKVAAAVTGRTKAVLPVHLYGAMVDMRALRETADAHDLFIIEDSAHCIEAERDGVRPGQFGDCSCNSFYATKNLTCGEGGALITKDEDMAKRVRRSANHGMSKNAAGRYQGKYEHWDMVAEGWKYNLDDVHAAMMVHQLDRLDALWERKNAVVERYDAGFAGAPGIVRHKVPGKSAHHLYTLWVDPDRRDEILHQLKERGVGAAVNYRAIHTLRYLRETLKHKPEDFPEALRIGRSTITLPLYPSLTDEQVEYVVETVRDVAAGRS